MMGKIAVFLLAVTVVTALPKPDGYPFGRIINGRIVGGSEAKPHSIPWIVDMRQSSHYCGGSIISPEWVVTAAHCSTESPSNYQLVAGDHNIEQVDPEEQTRQVDVIIRHPSYGNGAQYQYDIALMHVSPPFEFNDIVQPIELPPTPGFDSGEVVTVSGWGALTQGGSSPDTLYTVDVPFVSDQDCRDAYGESAITDDMYCAGEAGKDSCQGDSGGPLTCTVNGTTYLCGIVSWGRGCALAGYPGVYTEASYFKEWVEGAIIPPDEDNSTFVEQNEGCGGALVGTSGQVSLKYGINQKCTWSLRANDVTGLRIVVYEAPNTGDRLYLTELNNNDGQPARSTEIFSAGDYIVSGPNVLLTLISNDNSEDDAGFRLHFYGTGYNGATGAVLSNRAAGNAIGSLSHPPSGGDYQSNELAVIVINPEQASTLTFTAFVVEDAGNCIFDMVNVVTLQDGQLNLRGTYCGSTLPPSVESEGPIVLTFVTDSSVQESGFQVSWA